MTSTLLEQRLEDIYCILELVDKGMTEKYPKLEALLKTTQRALKRALWAEKFI